MSSGRENIKESAKTLMRQCMGVKDGETVLIVTDEKRKEIAYPFVDAGRELGYDTVLVETNSQSKGEPNSIVTEAMANADVEFLITSMSYSHTHARGKAQGNGARLASMPMMTDEIAEKYLDANYKKIKEVSEKISDMLTNTEEVRVTTPAGTDLTFSVKGRTCLPDTGDLTEKGSLGNLPAGEAYIAPIENTGTGTFVCDKGDVIAYLGAMKDKVTMTLENGRIVNIEGGQSAQELRDFLSDKDEESNGIAELGIGTNPHVDLIGHPLVDEKVWGTIHIAFGTNKFMGGTRVSNIHYDCVIKNPTLYLDGKAIIKDGEHIYE